MMLVPGRVGSIEIGFRPIATIAKLGPWPYGRKPQGVAQFFLGSGRHSRGEGSGLGWAGLGGLGSRAGLGCGWLGWQP